MNWKQTIGLIITIGAIIALCFFVIFPAFYSEKPPERKEETKKSAESAEVEDRSVLPKLKGVNWKTQAKKPAEKKPADKAAGKVSGKATAVAGKETDEFASAEPAEETEPEPLLELQEMSWYEQEGYAVVVGAVKNISKKSMPSVQVHAMFEGKDQWLIASEHSMIDLNPIFPGQTSPFTVISRYYPEITDVMLDFRKFSGESIPWTRAENNEGETAAEEGGGAAAATNEVHEEVAPAVQ